MKIGYFITRFPYKKLLDDNEHFLNYSYGGAEIAAFHLAKQMAQRGHEIKVFTTSKNADDEIETYDNIEIYRFGTNFKLEKGSFSINLLKKPILTDLDIIHNHFTTPIGDIAAFYYLKKKKLPFVVTYHGDGQENYGNILRRFIVSFHNRFIIKKLLGKANTIISPSEEYINESRFLREFRDKITVIPNGVKVEDLEINISKEEIRKKLDLPKNAKIILFVGSLIPYKGPEVLVKAMQEVLKNIPQALLIMLGEGMMKDELKKLAKDLGIEENIIFAGFVGGQKKSMYYNCADVFCLPSTLNTEVFPIVLLEASAAGLPIIVSDLKTFDCIIEHNYNGFVTVKNNVSDLSKSIIKILNDENLRNNIGKNAKIKIKNFSWENIAKITETVYEELIL